MARRRSRPGHSETSRPSRFIWSFALLLVLPAAAVGWLGLRLIAQDRQLQAQQAAERRASAVDRAVADLERGVSATERQLDATGVRAVSAAEGDAAVVQFSSTRVRMTTGASLLFLPAPAEPSADLPAAISDPERLELRGDLASALRAYRAAATTAASAQVRAEALVRVARTLRKMKRPGDAINTYRQLASLMPARVAGVPVDLLARRASATVYAELRDRAALTREAESLAGDLLKSKWSLDRGTFDAYLSETDGWLERLAVVPEGRRALSEAVAWFAEARDRGLVAGSGRDLRRFAGLDITALWRSSGPDDTTLLVGTPRYVAHTWIDPMAGAWTARGLVLSIGTSAVDDTAGPAQRGDRTIATKRSATETGLPWSIAMAEMGAPTPPVSREWTIVAGVAVMFAVIAAAGWVTARSVARELDFARLQADFVSAVSHEFRTPLTSLRQFTSLLGEPDEPPVDKRRMFNQAQARATERLERLVDALLDFGRMEAGRHPYRFTPASAAQLVQTAADEFRREALPGDFALECVAPDDGTLVDLDERALKRALRNLLENAVKYSGEGRRIGIALEQNGSDLSIGVSDEGLGIPRDEQRRIFDKFVRGSASRTNGIPGTGLGLAMVRDIVAAHGGRVVVASAPHRGSTFTIHLPLVARGSSDQP